MNVVSYYFSLDKQAVGFLRSKQRQRPFSNNDAYNISLITNIFIIKNRFMFVCVCVCLYVCLLFVCPVCIIVIRE